MTATWATPPISKGQTWPANRKSQTLITTFLQRRRDAQPIKLICGVEGCGHKVLGRFADARGRLELHRVDVHPGWVAPKGKRQ